jgi:hypothetical protein
MNIWLWIHEKIENAIRARYNEADEPEENYKQPTKAIRGISTLAGSSRKERLVDYDSSDDNSLSNERRITFHVYPSIGGSVIETRQFDTRKEDHVLTRYVINDEADFAMEVAKIVQLRMMTNI